MGKTCSSCHQGWSGTHYVLGILLPLGLGIPIDVFIDTRPKLRIYDVPVDLLPSCQTGNQQGGYRSTRCIVGDVKLKRNRRITHVLRAHGPSWSHDARQIISRPHEDKNSDIRLLLYRSTAVQMPTRNKHLVCFVLCGSVSSFLILIPGSIFVSQELPHLLFQSECANSDLNFIDLRIRWPTSSDFGVYS